MLLTGIRAVLPLFLYEKSRIFKGFPARAFLWPKRFYLSGLTLKGLRIETPVGSESDTLRVTTISVCSSNVSEIMRSALSFPSATLNGPQRSG